jgi:hypothetical protein
MRKAAAHVITLQVQCIVQIQYNCFILHAVLPT